MPELPDVTIYIEALESRIVGHTLERVQIASVFLMRTATPPISTIEGQEVLRLRRLGKRICFGFADELWLVLHLMIAGRLHWKDLSTLQSASKKKKRANLSFRSNQRTNWPLFNSTTDRCR